LPQNIQPTFAPAFLRLAWSNLAAQSAEQIALSAASLVAVLTFGMGTGGTGLLQAAQTLPFLLLSIPGRWCTWRLEVEIAPTPRLLCDDRLATDGIWASGRQHPIKHRHADGSLGLLGREAAGPQPGSDQRLVATHCRFY